MPQTALLPRPGLAADPPRPRGRFDHRRIGRRRGLVAAAVVLNQLAYGSVYSWSILSAGLQAPGSAFALGRDEAGLPFATAHALVFLGTVLGGLLMSRRPPRGIALLAGALYAGGLLVAGCAHGRQDFWLVLLGYGVISGVGLGLGYIVPTTLLQRWFPGHRALAAAVATGGFGLGSVLSAPLMRVLVAHFAGNPVRALLVLGGLFLVTTLTGAAFFRDPPRAVAAPARRGAAGGAGYRPAQALRTRQWYLLTLILFFNTAAGISMLSVIAPAAGSLTGLSPTAAAALTGALGVFNTVGRPLWGWFSGRTGLRRAFVLMLASQGLCLMALSRVASPALFLPLAALVCLSFGGGFATMPALASDFFGLAHAGGVYGLMLIGWSLAGIAGPLLVSGLAAESSYRTAFLVLGAVTLAAAVLPRLTRRPPAAAAASSDATAAMAATA
ncbi:MFS transporter [Kitasatospora sp. NBC_01287]|uniref:MFS transporter n=1 Tax=Kitasatospora sp. NBC_01287 TaxID=2903573 RepID=UPI0022508A82|nr:MFS transporter [Kitasatospora sp. NBC_01287]MCX4749030.1 MFS transporter [Kitasatospora sp. NBC_01287]